MEKEKPINTQFEGLVQGITPERTIESIHQMMICPKCKHIYWNPQMCSTPKCGQTLCEPCLKRALEGGETCDKCKNSTKYEPNPFVANSLTGLTFRCMNHPKCEIIIEYEDLPHHICIYDQMKCPMWGCKWKGESKHQLEEHLPICSKEITLCPNEGCGEKEERGRLYQHRDECLFEEIYCPKECGYKGRRGVLTQHIDMECAKVKMPCPQCEFLFLRRELAAHRCLPFLLGMIAEQAERIAEQESKYTILEVSQNTLEARILKIEEKCMREIREMDEKRLIKCQICKKLKNRSTFHECSKCQNNSCVECAPLCNKCHNHVCLNCFIPCYNCHTKYCSCNLTHCTKCNKKFCECAPFINCTVCNQSSCPAHINTCQICTLKYCSCTPLEACVQCNKKYCSCTPLEACVQCNKKYCSCTPLEACFQCNKKYCSCTPLVGCIQCKAPICNGCSNNIEGIGNVCGGCLQQAHNNKLELRAISATSTYSSSCELSNLLQGGNGSYWVSKEYGGGEHPSASDHIILGCKTGSMAITKLIIRLHPSYGFNKMEMYVGEEGNWTLSHTLTQSQEENMIICLPHPLSAKFIKLKFTGVKYRYFVIYEVQVFGIQLP